MSSTQYVSHNGQIFANNFYIVNRIKYAFKFPKYVKIKLYVTCAFIFLGIVRLKVANKQNKLS